MTTGKADPNYAAALAAVRGALAAVSGTDPASGAPYAPDYAGLPTELGGAAGAAARRRRRSEAGDRLAGLRDSA